MNVVRHVDAKNDKLCVLLLEDDDADAYLTGRALLSMTRVSQVVRARNGQEAIDMLDAKTIVPDIAFVDLQMPTMDGLSFLSNCMNQGLANVPLIVLTSSSDWKDALRSRVNGALNVITKPDSPAELKLALQEAIDIFAPVPTPRNNDQLQGLEQSHRTLPGPQLGAAGAPVQNAPQFGRRQPR